MNKVIFVIVGLIIGCGAGFFISRATIPEAVEPEPLIVVHTNTVEVVKEIQVDNSREKDLLLEAIKELNLTSSELKQARSQLTEQEPMISRFQWLMDFLRTQGFDKLHKLQFGWHSYTPNEELGKFLGWDDKLINQIKEVGKQTNEAVKDWEGERAEYVETEEDVLTYRIPPVPEGIKQQYLEKLTEVLPPDDYELLSSQLGKQFDRISSARIVTLSVGPRPKYMGGPSDKELMWIKERNEESGTQALTTMIPYLRGKTLPYGWNHIFKLERDPDVQSPSSGKGEYITEMSGILETSQ